MPFDTPVWRRANGVGYLNTMFYWNNDLPAVMRFSVPPRPDLTRTLAAVETEYIRNVLASVGGNRTKAAFVLGIDRKTLREKLKNATDRPSA